MRYRDLISERLTDFLRPVRSKAGSDQNRHDYLSIGHTKGNSVVWYMVHGSIVEVPYTGRRDNHDQKDENIATAVGRIDHAKKMISIRTPRDYDFGLPEARIKLVAKRLAEKYPDYEIWYFGGAPGDIRRIEESMVTEVQRPADRQEVYLHMLIAGWKPISEHGAFADVYRKPGAPYVLKVFDAHDEAYLAFIALARSHPNPHFPKFIGKLIRVAPTIYAVRMEPLTPYHGDPTAFYWYMLHRDRIPTLAPNSDIAMKIGDAEEVFYEHPELKQALDLIIDNLRPKFEVDIKQNNIMMRGDTMVLTDPVKNRIVPPNITDGKP